jgi:putative ABC transport system permease protein
VILFIGGLVVLVTMMGSVRERTREIGIFRAVGFRRTHILQIVLLEAGIISALAGILGYGAGWASAAAALAFFGDAHSGHVPFAPGLAAESVALAMALGLIASVYPAQMGARMDPNEALRSL